MPRLSQEQRRARDEQIARENEEAIAAALREIEERDFRQRLLAEVMAERALREAVEILMRRAGGTIH